MNKSIFMLAGPNGAGKTTTALSLIPDLLSIYEFLNADEIARGLAPLQPHTMALTASKLMIKRLKELLLADKSFVFETTASGSNYIKYLKEAHQLGYEINLLFLWLSSPDLAVKRVAQRVSQGGHHIPEETIRRRYRTGLKNFINLYFPIADSVLIIDNSVADDQKMIAYWENKTLKINNEITWELIQRQANE